MTRGRTNPDRDRANATSRRPPPPAYLTDAEGAIWTRVCKDQSGEWCEVAKGGMALAMYCETRALYEAIKAAKDAAVLAAPDPEAALTSAKAHHEALAKLGPELLSLETKLRLTHQSRQQKDGPQGAGPRNPWDPVDPEDDGDEDGAT